MIDKTTIIEYNKIKRNIDFFVFFSGFFTTLGVCYIILFMMSIAQNSAPWWITGISAFMCLLNYFLYKWTLNIILMYEIYLNNLIENIKFS